MKAESTLAKMISTAGEKAAYDRACKRLLANKIILAWIMKSCLEEYRDCEISEIASRYIEGEAQISEVAVHPDEEVQSQQIIGLNTEDSTINEGTVTYDIRFRAIVPGTGEKISLIINIGSKRFLSRVSSCKKKSVLLLQTGFFTIWNRIYELSL